MLPTVCAGGFPNTSVGNNASLTVKNTEREQEKRSMFQNIYMSHEAGSDGNVPYTGTAELHLDSAVLVRERFLQTGTVLQKYLFREAAFSAK